MLLDVPYYVFVRIYFVTNLVVQVRSVERRLEDGSVHDSEILLNVVLDLRGGCRRQGHDRSPAYHLDHVPDPAVLRPEVMSPFGNAMGLIHGVERDLHLPKQIHILLFCKRLRSHVKQFGHTGKNIRPDLLDLGSVQGRVQEMSDSVLFLHKPADHIHLIFHQGDQRRDHDGSARHNQGRQLET